MTAFLQRTEVMEMANFKGHAKLDRRDEMILVLVAVLTPLTALPMVFGA